MHYMDCYVHNYVTREAAVAAAVAACVCAHLTELSMGGVR